MKTMAAASDGIEDPHPAYPMCQPKTCQPKMCKPKTCQPKTPSTYRRAQLLIFGLALLVISACKADHEQPGLEHQLLVDHVPDERPQVFKPEWVPEGYLQHSGVFSPDLQEFYFTLSDREFQQFTVRRVQRRETSWSQPEDAFFNSDYNEHGTSFSPDGQRLFFSSTRPTGRPDVADTWHLWTSSKTDEAWAEPTFVDIPNMRDRLVSHGWSTRDGTLYFHAGPLDYSELDLYRTQLEDGEYSPAEKLPTTINSLGLECTPFISPDGNYLIFERVPDLFISFKDSQGAWQTAQRLSDRINSSGRGNPFVTPDGRFLFYAAGPDPLPDETEGWAVHWVSTDSFLNPPTPLAEQPGS